MKQTYPLVQIGKVVSSVQKWNPLDSKTNDFFTYIDISSVNRDTKQVEETVKILNHEAPSRARQLVKAEDILVSTVRPNLNAVAYLDARFDGATVSTGFTVLRAKPEKLCPRYLYYWVRTPFFVDKMVQKSTGASYPAVSDTIVKQSSLPLPPLEEQQRIAAILDKADAVRKKRSLAIQLTEELLRATFLDMFGDPVTNSKGWIAGTILDVVTNPRTDVRCGPFGTQLKVEEIVSEGIPLIGIENVRGGRFQASTKKHITSSKAKELAAFDVQPDDVLVTRMGTIGHACVVPQGIKEARISYHLFRIRPNVEKCLPGFLASTITWSGTFLTQLERLSHGAIMAGLKTADLKEVRFLLPPVDLQKQYLNIVVKTEKLLENQKKRMICEEAFFNTLLHRAFRGEL